MIPHPQGFESKGLGVTAQMQVFRPVNDPLDFG
jgi:hypothetical protein